MIIKLNKKRKGEINFSYNYVDISGIRIETNHDQECCERVYADFSVFEFFKEEIKKREIVKIEIKKVENTGFIIFVYFFNKYQEERTGILVNCYNEQNGFYSDELEIKVYKDKKLLESFDAEKYDIEV